MPTENDRFSEFDPSAVSLPSDQVTLGALRRREPELFTVKSLLVRKLDSEIVGTMHTELTLAEKAFASALGHRDPYPHDSRQELLEILNDDYVRYGISTGLQQTRQLVRAFETAAAEQARPGRSAG